jgi:hypothetical protein
MKSFYLKLLFLFGPILSVFSITSGKDSALLIFPQTRIFPVVFIDPLECQLSGSSTFLFRKDNDLSLYNQVNFGLIKPVIARHTEKISWEINFGAGTFTQFDLLKKASGSFLAGLLNNDYKISADFSLQIDNNIFRIRTFHLSSHLGDDYMLRHNDTIPNDKSNNYEQVDLTYLHAKANDYWYLGAGEIYTVYSFRKRFSLFCGGLWTFGKLERINFFGTFNLKFLQENSFAPDFRDAYGINLMRNHERYMRIWVEFYSGHLPYSTLKYGRISWMGAGMSILVF